MDKLNFDRLIDAYLDDSASDADKTLLEAYYEKLQNGEPLNLLKGEEAALEVVMYRNIISGIGALPKRKQGIKLWTGIGLAAAAVAAIVFGIWFYNQEVASLRNALRNEVTYRNDIDPGKNIATLTFSNGKTIKLSERKTGVVIGDDLRYDDNTAVISGTGKKSLPLGRDENGEGVMTLTTPRGGTYQITLFEGTKVWLNAASRLIYTIGLNDQGERLVKLEGEAYFEVAKDKIHPFIVESTGQRVEVLGTHFNIKGYADEGATVTTLIEGRVQVSASRDDGQGGARILKPNQQSTLSNNSLTIGEADPNAIVWIKGKFSFYDTPLQDVMKQLARWYDVEVVYPDGVPLRKFTGDINRNVSASEALGLFKFSGVQFTIEGKKIIVNNNN
ncbi:transmembrane sensor [Pedobacter africanus]|uniref:Uncharacterized protein n=1 Tax=Pedobacter africanus TaxID=151894 RepID=A0ACC6L1J0_9SPHI|nr:FecR domain-containing protein [Pedobacter africanus]MDR6785500.1 hypothetical protein [Pedobacter africanus]